MLRLPLAFLIVAGHANTLKFPLRANEQLVAYDYNIIKYPIHLLSDILFGPAVPLFFMISGFLFFMGLNHFDMVTYKQKIKRRAKTLLIPYLLWNFIYLLPTLANTLLGKYNYDVWYFIESLWIMPNQLDRISEMTMATPADPPLWFIRDLMVCLVLSPVIWFVARKKMICIIVVVLLAAPWFFSIPCLFPFPGISIPSLLFFMIGSMAAVWDVNIARWLSNVNMSKFLIGIFFILSIIELIMVDYSFSLNGESVSVTIEQNIYLHAILVLGGCFAFLFVAYRLASHVAGAWGGHFLCSQVTGCSSILQRRLFHVSVQ